MMFGFLYFTVTGAHHITSHHIYSAQCQSVFNIFCANYPDCLQLIHRMQTKQEKNGKQSERNEITQINFFLVFWFPWILTRKILRAFFFSFLFNSIWIISWKYTMKTENSNAMNRKCERNSLLKLSFSPEIFPFNLIWKQNYFRPSEIDCILTQFVVFKFIN